MFFSLRKADFLLFFFFAAVAALVAAVPLIRPAAAEGEGGKMVKIISRGDELGIFPLGEDKEIDISRYGHENIVIIEDNTVYMDYSNCKNQICVNTGKISQTGETIVCLPNSVIVEIINTEGGEDDEAIDAVVK